MEGSVGRGGKSEPGTWYRVQATAGVSSDCATRALKRIRSDTARSLDEGHRLLENTVTMLERQLRRSDNRIQELERLCELQQVRQRVSLCRFEVFCSHFVSFPGIPHGVEV
ncbi:unnamed protein product [Heligmosomoides polygyrus]|uniref:Tektin n=1 Tax=Heligmosomoides polygyrus TaxID=6339 RepID=A0A183G156_HELPZ|nr:unnamed protein product [Heligmosomoides polygyrus]